MKYCTSGLSFKQKGKFSNTVIDLNRDFNLNEDQLENSISFAVRSVFRVMC